ncbi:MAG: TolC family protein [Gammaproteobacteria bacterium]|nr:MAG: TolC family protein [Gammaproteobacteria bacterium]
MRSNNIGIALFISCVIGSSALADTVLSPPDPVSSGAIVSSGIAEKTKTLSRKQTIAYALAHNPGLRAANQLEQAARARRLQADGFDSPTVFWEVEESDNSNVNEAGNQIYGIEQSFEWVGVRQARKQAADLGISAASANVERTRLRVTARTEKVFDQALLAEHIRKLLEQVSNLTRDAVGISRVRFKSGAGSYLDLLRTQVAHKRLQNKLLDAEVRVTTTRRQLNVVIGTDNEIIIPAGKLSYRSMDLDPRQWLDKLNRSGPTFVLLKRRNEQSERLLTATRRARLPEITASLGRQRLYNGVDSEFTWAATLGFKLPLPGSDRQSGLEAEATANSLALRDQSRALQMSALEKFKARIDQARSLETQLQTYADTILLDVQDERKAAEQAYRVRRIDALNLLDVYGTFLEMQRTYFETIVRYRSALADLNALGEDLWEVEL